MVRTVVRNVETHTPHVEIVRLVDSITMALYNVINIILHRRSSAVWNDYVIRSSILVLLNGGDIPPSVGGEGVPRGGELVSGG
jgi:hypothetical protein